MDEQHNRRGDDVRIAVLGEKLNGLIATVEKSEEESEKWRISFCKKLDSIFAKLDLLPCEHAQEETRSLMRDVGWLQKIVWTICVISIPALVGLAVAWGSTIETVQHDTVAIQQLQGFKSEIISTIGVRTYPEGTSEDTAKKAINNVK